jgi:hypothetical protein
LTLRFANTFQRLRVNLLLTTIMVNQSGDTIFCARNQNFLPWQRNFTRSSLVFIYNTHRIMIWNSRRTIKWSGSHLGSHNQTIHQARSHPWIVELPFSLILHPFTKTAKLIGSIEFPSVIETNTSARKQSHPSSPSITSGITGMSLSTSTHGGPSYAYIWCKPTTTPTYLYPH